VVLKTWEGKARRSGKPDAVKAARPVWEGIIGNVITTVRMWITRAGYLLHRTLEAFYERLQPFAVPFMAGAGP
jgi:hypothetical protein